MTRIPDATRPSDLDMTRQLGRFWARRSAISGGISFVEPAASTPGNVYAAPLPAKAHRLAPAASITIAGASAPGGNDPTTAIGLTITVRAPDLDDCFAWLADLRRLIRPAEKTFADAGVYGIAGAPALAAQEIRRVWRILAFDVLSEAQPQAIGGSAQQTDEGEAEAVMSIAAHAIPIRIGAALSLTNSDAATFESATARVFEPRMLELIETDINGSDPGSTNQLDLAQHTLASLVAAINALDAEWVAADQLSVQQSLSAGRLLTIPTTELITGGQAATIRLAAWLGD